MINQNRNDIMFNSTGNYSVFFIKNFYRVSIMNKVQKRLLQVYGFTRHFVLFITNILDKGRKG